MKMAAVGRIECKVVVELSLEELAALNALFGYGVDGFLQVFYREMGKSYLQPHEAGLRSLHDTVVEQTSGIVTRIQHADDVLRGRKKVQP